MAKLQQYSFFAFRQMQTHPHHICNNNLPNPVLISIKASLNDVTCILIKMKHLRYTILIILISTNIYGQKSKNIPVLDPNAQDTLLMDTIQYEDDLDMFQTSINGRLMTALITESGDTLIMETLEDISITSLRKFKSAADYAKYMKFKRYAALVYPYAKEAIKIFRETEVATQTMNRRKRKKHIKKLQKDLKVKFEEPLKKLTKLQGKILIKMIERELDQNMFTLIKGLRGSFAAFYWHNASKLYSYDLKEGYQEGKYDILDAVLQDFDISYRIEQEEINKKN